MSYFTGCETLFQKTDNEVNIASFRRQIQYYLVGSLKRNFQMDPAGQLRDNGMAALRWMVLQLYEYLRLRDQLADLEVHRCLFTGTYLSLVSCF